jgi:O-antigen ligase
LRAQAISVQAAHPLPNGNAIHGTAILFGFALVLMGARGEALRGLVDDVAKAMFGIINIVMRAAPIGAFGALAYTIGVNGPKFFGNLFFLIAMFYATAIIFVVVVLGLFALFAGRSVYRMQEAGSEDARWCSFASTFNAIKDNWIFGTGVGAFQDVFPVYRDSDCAGIFGFWDRAHNFFLEGWLGLGLPFLAAMAIGYAILVGVFIRGIRIRHRFRYIPVMGLAVLILASLHSIVDFSLQIPGVGVYFAAIMAATVTVSLGRVRE